MQLPQASCSCVVPAFTAVQQYGSLVPQKVQPAASCNLMNQLFCSKDAPSNMGTALNALVDCRQCQTSSSWW